MRLRLVTTLVVAISLMLAAIADAKVLTVVKSRTKANPSVSASGFLEFPKKFRVTITSNKGGMRITGSVATISCNHGENSRAKNVPLKGSPRLSKSFKPSMKHSQACFVSIAVVGDRPGKVTVKLTGTQRKGSNSTAAAEAPAEPEPTPEPAPESP